MAGKQQSGHQGQVKDPAHDGRLKGHHGGEAQQAHKSSQKGQEEQNQQSRGGSSRGESERSAGQPKNGSQGQGGSDDLKLREYRDAEGNVRHHTKSYMEQHKGE